MKLYTELFTALGFSKKWTNWIMQYITTISFYVQVNGIPGNEAFDREIIYLRTISLFALSILVEIFII